MGANTSPVQPEMHVTNPKEISYFNRHIQQAKRVIEIMKTHFGWIAYIEQDGNQFRVKTGTFAGIATARTAENKINAARLALVTYIFEA